MHNSQHHTHWKYTLLIRASIANHLVALCIMIIAPAQWAWAVIAVVINHLILSAIGLWPRSIWLGQNWSRLPAAATARNEIALTIDDGPDPIVTPQVLDLLDKYAVKATFFCIGEKVARHPDICREIVRRGHTIENHSQRHPLYFSLLGPNGFRREILAAQDTLSAITGQTPVFFRAPAGLRNPFLAPVLIQLGLTLASWSVRGFDTQVTDSKKISDKLLHNLRAGAILLLHDGNAARSPDGIPVILEVLPNVLAYAKAKQLHLVTLRHALT